MSDTNIFLILLVFGIYWVSTIPEKEGHIYRRKSWIIAGIILPPLMAGYAVARAKQSRKLGFVTIFIVSLIKVIYLELQWIIGGYIIYWAWKQIPDEKKDYSLLWKKNKTVKQVK